MAGKRLLLAGSALALGLLAWPVATSAMFVGVAPWASPPTISNPAPAFYYWRDYRETRVVKHWMPPCALGSGLLCLLPAGLLAFVRPSRRLRAARPGEPVPEPVRARSDVHGSAHWMSPVEAVRWFPGPAADHGGVVVGELEDGRLLVDQCTSDAGHGALFSGSGGGKTAGCTIPTLDPHVGWRGSVVVFDPSCEVGPMTREMREAEGQRVVMLTPGGAGFNVLDWIDTTDMLAEAHVETVIDTIGPESEESGKDPMFPIMGRNLQLCIIADMLWDDTIPRAERTLRLFSDRMAMPEPDMKERLHVIHQESQSPMARKLAGALVGIAGRTFQGIYANAQADIRWLMIGAYADLVSGNAMTTDELAKGDLTVYVQIPLATLQGTPEVGRTIVNALLQGIYRHEGKTRQRVLFLLDEVNLLGKMKSLAVARDNARKYGVTLVCMWQSLGQLSDTWGEGGKSAWLESTSWQAFAAVSDPKTAEEVSKRCGTYTVLGQTESASRGSSSGRSGSRNRGQNIGQSEQARLLIRPEEIQSKLPRGERIVFQKGASGPLRCRPALWFKRVGMFARVRNNRV